MFKFELGSMVKVQVFNIITKGVVRKRIYSETKEGVNVKYHIFIESIGDLVDPWEEDLVYVQTLAFGEINEN